MRPRTRAGDETGAAVRARTTRSTTSGPDSIGFLWIFLCILAGSATCASPSEAQVHEPPPPLGPPVAAAEAPGSFFLDIVRPRIESVVDSVLLAINERPGNPATVSWASGARPTECGRDCIGRPFLTETRHLDHPNQRFVQSFGRIALDVDIPGPFNRRIVANLTLRFFCDGWEDGSGELVVRSEVGQFFIAGGTSLFEDIVDFVLLPLAISRSIDARVAAELPDPADSGSPTGFRCRSLGPFQGQSSNFDAVVFDFPGSGPTLPTLARETATVTFETVRRLEPFAGLGSPDDSVALLAFVHGRGLGLPERGRIALPAGAEASLDGLSVSLPVDALDELQVILADSFGGSAWVSFGRDARFGRGTHVLRTHRRGFIPPGSPGSPPGSTRPTPVDVREIEVEFSIQVTDSDVLAPVSGPGS